MYTVINVHTHTKEKKAKPLAAMQNIAQYCRPVNQHWDACAPLRHFNLVQAYPPGAGLVTHRRTVQRKIMDLKFHNNPNTTK